jgi:hypothetical protein
MGQEECFMNNDVLEIENENVQNGTQSEGLHFRTFQHTTIYVNRHSSIYVVMGFHKKVTGGGIM